VRGLDWLMKMKPVSFRYKTDAKAQLAPLVGFIAEDMAAINPLFATHGPDGQVQNYEDRAVIATLVKAVQEQQAEIEQLKAAVSALGGGHLTANAR
jgi:hypothetical protein